MILELPPFSKFLEELDKDTFDYDFDKYSTERLKRSHIPFSEEQSRFLVDANVVLIETLLTQYHQWLCGQMRNAVGELGDGSCGEDSWQ